MSETQCLKVTFKVSHATATPAESGYSTPVRLRKGQLKHLNLKSIEKASKKVLDFFSQQSRGMLDTEGVILGWPIIFYGSQCLIIL